MIMLAGIFMYIGYYSYAIFKKWDVLLNRHKIFCQISALYILLIAVLTGSGFYYYSASGVSIVAGILAANFYIYTLNFVYCYSWRAEIEIKRLMELEQIDKDSDYNYKALKYFQENQLDQEYDHEHFESDNHHHDQQSTGEKKIPLDFDDDDLDS